MTRSTRRVATGLGIMATLFAAAACGGGDGGSGDGEFEEMTLTYTAWIGTDIGHATAMEEFIAAIEERTDGAVTFETYYDGALCAAPETMECISSRKADVGFGSAVYTPADMPASTLGSVPFQTLNAQASTNALNDMYRENESFRAEWEATNQHLLWFAPGAMPLLGMTQPIESVDDLDGLSIRTVGYTVSPMAELGVNAVATAPAEQYESLQRGVIDGTLYTTDGFIDSRLYEVVDYIYDLGEYMGTYATLYTAINQELWATMSPELQEIFTEESEKIAGDFATNYLEPYDEEACALLADEVGTIDRLGEDDSSQAWADDMKDLAMSEWLAAAQKAGLADPEALRDDFLSRVASYEETTEFRSGGEICREAAGS